MSKDKLTADFDLRLQVYSPASIKRPVKEYRFHPARRWRFDRAWPDKKVAVEIDGGQWTRGRHNRGAGMEKDNEKINTATAMGWRVFRLCTNMVYDEQSYQPIYNALRRENEN